MDTFRDLIPLLLVLAVTAVIWFLSRKARSKRPQGTPGDHYTVVLSSESVSCTHPARPTEVVLWNDVEEIRLVNTSDPPPLPFLWLVLEGRQGGCSIPLEAKGLESFWSAAEKRFPGLKEDSLDPETPGQSESVLWSKSSPPNLSL